MSQVTKNRNYYAKQVKRKLAFSILASKLFVTEAFLV